MTATQTTDLTSIKGRQHKAWSSGDYGKAGPLYKAFKMLDEEGQKEKI